MTHWHFPHISFRNSTLPFDQMVLKVTTYGLLHHYAILYVTNTYWWGSHFGNLAKPHWRDFEREKNPVRISNKNWWCGLHVILPYTNVNREMCTANMSYYSIIFSYLNSIHSSLVFSCSWSRWILSLSQTYTSTPTDQFSLASSTCQHVFSVRENQKKRLEKTMQPDGNMSLGSKQRSWSCKTVTRPTATRPTASQCRS